MTGPIRPSGSARPPSTILPFPLLLTRTWVEMLPPFSVERGRTVDGRRGEREAREDFVDDPEAVWVWEGPAEEGPEVRVARNDLS